MIFERIMDEKRTAASMKNLINATAPFYVYVSFIYVSFIYVSFNSS